MNVLQKKRPSKQVNNRLAFHPITTHSNGQQKRLSKNRVIHQKRGKQMRQRAVPNKILVRRRFGLFNVLFSGRFFFVGLDRTADFCLPRDCSGKNNGKRMAEWRISCDILAASIGGRGRLADLTCFSPSFNQTRQQTSYFDDDNPTFVPRHRRRCVPFLFAPRCTSAAISFASLVTMNSPGEQVRCCSFFFIIFLKTPATDASCSIYIGTDCQSNT